MLFEVYSNLIFSTFNNSEDTEVTNSKPGSAVYSCLNWFFAYI